MAKRRTDEGSNSDSSTGSLQEISADDFKRQDARGSSRSRVWMNDLMRYPVTRNYNQDLYSFAWAQAVQNKPLGFDVKPVKQDDDDEIEMFVEDDNDDGKEKEEGELEEGEIELGSEPVNLEMKDEKAEEKVESEEKVEEIAEFDMRVGVILEELETITEEEAESSFEEVCSRLQKCFASLKQMFSEAEVPVLDVLVQQAFMRIQTLYSAYKSGNLKKMDQNKELLLRLLIHIKNQYSVFLAPEQVKEIDVKVHTLASEAIFSNTNGSANVASTAGISLERPKLGPTGINLIGSNVGKAGLPMIHVPTPTSRSRVDFSPLLNLHADYDEDSLPSPTRDNAPPLPVLKPIGFGTGASVTVQPTALRNAEIESSTFHPYVKDAFKAVSSYQQKYGKNSVVVSNQLPSPTPSEEANDDNDDARGEVSSARNTLNDRAAGPSTGAIANTNTSTGSQPVPVKTVAPNPVVKSAAKSRDPRLRFMNSDVGGAPQNGHAVGAMNPRKHKAIEEPSVDDSNSKRQRNGLARDVPMASGRGDGIEDNIVMAPQAINRAQPNGNMIAGNRNNNGEVYPDSRFNVNSNFNGISASNISASNAPSVSLPSLLKDIVVNPAMLMELVMKEQQRIAAAESQKQAAGPAGGVLPNAANNAPMKNLEPAKNPAAKPQMAPQSTPMSTQNDVGKIRMKPRDPRRILHTNIAQKSDRVGLEATKTSSTLQSDMQSSNDRFTVAEQGEQAQQAVVPSLSAPQPDISRQFTKNLKNVANFMSSSQATPALPPGYQNISQPIPSKMSNDWAEPKTVAESSNQAGSNQAGSSSGGPQWGDVDHLLDGYDDHEKAAIQKERARRIAEQNKMFAARKLCLVLDLDHTLLNSAKFIEVDPVHEEILRKKEEQDREKPERHLFRFQHMGMWTKLRPGIWNFLEKASKLFELHLYTMGNKLYATEMAKVLDPSGALFAGRVISKGDDGEPFDGDERVPKSKDLDGVLGMESAVVIIDDSVRVWPHNKLNLIVVERYTYFPCSRRQFGLLGPSLLEIDHDERTEEGTLASVLGVIERIHRNFFSHPALNEIDVRNILASEQRNILSGCKIVFSRVFPVGEANPHLHPLWQTAEQFGAECTNQIDEHVTHVVANSLGTDKVNWAISTGRFVVHPGWVEASALLYRRANEQDFVVKL